MRVRVRLHAFVCLIAAAVALSWLAAGGAVAQSVGERIESYDVSIDIQRDGSIAVTEAIVYDFAGAEHHGIFRTIPVRYHHDDRFDRIYRLRVLSVDGSPGTPDQYKVIKSGSSLEIRIGDPDRTITGRHEYTITYRVEGALNGFADHDELYWNAIGSEWETTSAQRSGRSSTSRKPRT